MGIFSLILGMTFLLPTFTEAAPIKLSYAGFPPAKTFPCVQAEQWKKEVEKLTNGKVVVNTFPGSTLLGAKNMMDGVIAGTADIGCLCMAYQPGRFMVTNATSLPFGFPNTRVASLALWDLYQKYNPKEFSKVKVITMFTCPPSNIMSSKPIRSLEDLKGFSIRASGMAAQVMKIWGANAVGMPQSETPEALQKGVVKGVFSSLECLKDFKYAETCRYVTMTNTVIYPFAAVMNMDKWNSLPKDVQQVIDGLSRKTAEWTGVYNDNHLKEAVAWSKKKYNVEIITLPEDELAKWNKLLQPMTQNWVNKAKEKNLPAEAILKDIAAFAKR